MSLLQFQVQSLKNDSCHLKWIAQSRRLILQSRDLKDVNFHYVFALGWQLTDTKGNQYLELSELIRTVNVFYHLQLYFPLSRTASPQNASILTTDGSNRTKNIVLSELFGMHYNIFLVRKSVVSKHLTPNLFLGRRLVERSWILVNLSQPSSALL